MGEARTMLDGEARTMLDEVSHAIADVYRGHFDIERTGVSSYMIDDVLICVLENVGDISEQTADRSLGQRRAFQHDHEDEFSEAVERLSGRHVRTFLSANHVAQGIAAEVFFLSPTPDG
jgi:hypothetical protein